LEECNHALSRNDPILLEELNKNEGNLSHDSECLGRESNQTPPEQKSGASPLHQLVRFVTLCYFASCSILYFSSDFHHFFLHFISFSLCHVIARQTIVHPLCISLWATNCANLPCKCCDVSWKCLRPTPLVIIVDWAVATSYYSLCRFGDKPTSWGFIAPCVSCRNTTLSSMKPFSCKLQASSIKCLTFSNSASFIWNLLILLAGVWSEELKNEQFREILLPFQVSVPTTAIYIAKLVLKHYSALSLEVINLRSSIGRSNTTWGYEWNAGLILVFYIFLIHENFEFSDRVHVFIDYISTTFPVLYTLCTEGRICHSLDSLKKRGDTSVVTEMGYGPDDRGIGDRISARPRVLLNSVQRWSGPHPASYVMCKLFNF
jgi:hypothetical protein